ncbi:MAG: hypothetical protein OER88_02125 [Planctomycetota bacterium]|nr:hypothetical protein [Planctomycetota bacterium]
MIGPLLVAVAVGLGAWWLFRKARRFFTTQPLSPVRHGLRLAFLSTIATLLMLLPLSSIAMKALAGSVGGLTAILSLRSTRFERRGGTWVFTPNLKIGAVLFALVVVRIVWRLFRIRDASAASIDLTDPWRWVPDGPRGWTILLLFVLFGYFLVYETGLLAAWLRRRDHT